LIGSLVQGNSDGVDDCGFGFPVCAQQFPVWRGNFPIGVQRFPFGLPREFAYKRLTENVGFHGSVDVFGKIPG
jgi:hypothetical protein